MIEGNKSFDISHRIVNFRGKPVDIYYISSISSDDVIGLLVKGITDDNGKTLSDCLSNSSVTQEDNIEKQEYALLSGNAVIKYKDITYVIEAREYPSRSIAEPETEKSVRGSKDGFNEAILTSVGLIRRRIKARDLIFDLHSVGTTNKLDLCIVYMDNKVDKVLLNKILDRIKSIQSNDLIMSDRAVEEIIMNQGYNPFPLVRYSERPDIVSTHIMNGFIAIICDTSSSVMMVPTNIFQILEHVEEHRQTPIIGSFIRIIRFTAVLLSVYLVPVWLLFWLHGQVDYIYVGQVILVELAIELLRIATVHTPTSLSNATGMIAAVLLGQFAINMGVFTEEILLYCAIGNVCGFATPSYELSLTNKYIKIGMIIITGIFGLWGFIGFNIILIAYMFHIKPFGYSYFYPLFPFNGKELLNAIIRKPKPKEKNL